MLQGAVAPTIVATPDIFLLHIFLFGMENTMTGTICHAVFPALQEYVQPLRMSDPEFFRVYDHGCTFPFWLY